MRFFIAIMGLFLALNIQAQASKAPTLGNIFSKDVTTMRQKPQVVVTEESFLSKEQVRLGKHEQAVTKASLAGQDLYYEGKVVYLVPSTTTTNGVETWYDKPCVIAPKISASGNQYYGWKTISKADWAILTGKQSSN